MLYILRVSWCPSAPRQRFLFSRQVFTELLASARVAATRRRGCADSDSGIGPEPHPSFIDFSGQTPLGYGYRRWREQGRTSQP
jgi:hypothetical protein